MTSLDCQKASSRTLMLAKTFGVRSLELTRFFVFDALPRFPAPILISSPFFLGEP